MNLDALQHLEWKLPDKNLSALFKCKHIKKVWLPCRSLSQTGFLFKSLFPWVVSYAEPSGISLHAKEKGTKNVSWHFYLFVRNLFGQITKVTALLNLIMQFWRIRRLVLLCYSIEKKRGLYCCWFGLKRYNISCWVHTGISKCQADKL